MLIASGAFADFKIESTSMIEQVEELILYSAACHDEEDSSQSNLFSNSIETITKPVFKTTNPISKSKRSKEIYDVTGVYFSHLSNVDPAFTSLFESKWLIVSKNKIPNFQIK